MNPKALKDLVSRAVWTALQAGVAVITVDQITEAIDGTEPVIVVTVIATLLSAVKSFLGSKVGNPEDVTFVES